MNGLQLFENTIEQTTETMLPRAKTITAAAMMTNRITGLRELSLSFLGCVLKQLKTNASRSNNFFCSLQQEITTL